MFKGKKLNPDGLDATHKCVCSLTDSLNSEIHCNKPKELSLHLNIKGLREARGHLGPLKRPRSRKNNLNPFRNVAQNWIAHLLELAISKQLSEALR